MTRIPKAAYDLMDEDNQNSLLGVLNRKHTDGQYGTRIILPMRVYCIDVVCHRSHSINSAQSSHA